MSDIRDQSGLCAVIVTFHPDLTRLEQMLRVLLPQVNEIVVVDNSGTSVAAQMMPICRGLPGVHIVDNGSNIGVAAAHNRGIEWARLRNHTDVLLMDQDSLPDADMVRTLVDVRRKLIEAGHRVSAAGPICVDARDGHQAYLHLYRGIGCKNLTADDADEDGVIWTDVLASSGSLISLDVIDRVGGMDESLFIDHVDTEWHLRARSLGFKAFACCQARLNHNLGDRTLRFWLGRWRYAPQHSPVRHYFMLRNSLLLMGRKYVPLAWKLYAARQTLATFLFYSLFGSPRRQHFLSMSRGIHDGLLSRSGPAG